jgi:hypothetical protein
VVGGCLAGVLCPGCDAEPLGCFAALGPLQLGKRDYVTGRMWKHNKAPYRLILNSAARKSINWHCEHYAARGVCPCCLRVRRRGSPERPGALPFLALGFVRMACVLG